MLENLGIYYIGQNVNSYKSYDLRVFSKKDYQLYKKFGMKLMFENEEFYYGQPIYFANTFWDYTTIGAINGIIYKIAIQIVGIKKELSNIVMKEVIHTINNSNGQFNIFKKSLFKKKYRWENKKNGNVFLTNRQLFLKYYMNLILTSYEFSHYNISENEYK